MNKSNTEKLMKIANEIEVLFIRNKLNLHETSSILCNLLAISIKHGCDNNEEDIARACEVFRKIIFDSAISFFKANNEA